MELLRPTVLLCMIVLLGRFGALRIMAWVKGRALVGKIELDAMPGLLGSVSTWRFAAYDTVGWSSFLNTHCLWWPYCFAWPSCRPNGHALRSKGRPILEGASQWVGTWHVNLLWLRLCCSALFLIILYPIYILLSFCCASMKALLLWEL